MSTAAFRRAQKMLDNRRGTVVGARALGLIHSLLLLALLVVAGLLVALVITRGSVRVPESAYGRVPPWLSSSLPIAGQARHRYPYEVFDDSGLYPLAANNQSARSPWVHRRGADMLLWAMAQVRMLRRNLSALATLLAVSLGLLLALTFVEQIRRALLARAVAETTASLRQQVHRHMYRRGQSSLPTEGVGPVVNLFTREVNEVGDGLAAQLDRGWRVPVLGAGLLLIALFLSLPLTVFLAALFGVVWLVARPLESRARRDWHALVRDAATQLQLLHEDLGMLRTVRVYGMEGIAKSRFEEHLDRHAEANRRMAAAGDPSPTSYLLLGASAVLAMGMLGFVVLGGRLSPAAAVVLMAALAALIRPAYLAFDLRRLRKQAGRSAAAVFDYLETRPELTQAVGAQFLPPLRERITLENVTLNDAAGRPMLAGVSLEIPARSRTAIIGLDEDAKHGLVCLLPRLIDPSVGRVRMDGLDLRDVTLESLRAQVALVLQSDLVFSDTVATNIGLGDESFTLPRIIEAAKVAHAHNFIQDLPDGYDTIIGPLGEYLTPDQQYRLALARAFLHDPSIVIVEEPLSSLDEDVKHLIDDTIDRLAPGRTLLFLPHRLSTIRKCDRVVVLHNGRVEAVGPPRDVHAQSKLYRHIQYVEFNQFATGEVEAGQMNA